MSSLIFITSPKDVLVATDTLATFPDGRPFMFTTKAFIVPHLRMIVAGTGAGGFLGRWFVQVNDRMVVRDVDHLDEHAPTVLAELWEEHRAEFSLPDEITTTVYHFGFSSSDGLVHTYVYRSSGGFSSERYERYGVGAKPECTPLTIESPDDIVAMMDEQRAIQSQRPIGKRVHVGGRILVHTLSEEGFTVHAIHKFDDYDSVERSIYENFGS